MPWTKDGYVNDSDYLRKVRNTAKIGRESFRSKIKAGVHLGAKIGKKAKKVLEERKLRY